MSAGVVFSLDYELHGNGAGSPLHLMVEPTARLLRQFERHGARLTIFAEVVEILRFREHRARTGRDDFGFDAIVAQLRAAVAAGHDVQLHLHPSYLNAHPGPDGWAQDWSEYELSRLPLPRLRTLVAETKAFLEETLRPVSPGYRVYAFRAGNWSMMPTRNLATALIENDIRIDSSVFKGGRRTGIVNFDYSTAPSAARPWPLDPADVCREDSGSPLWEFPIYCEMRPVWSFLTPQRLYRVRQSAMHRLRHFSGSHPGPDAPAHPAARILDALFRRHPWKADFNQCSARQLARALERAERRYGSAAAPVPFVLIGHSKLFTRYNERNLEGFLRFVAARPDRFGFALYRDFLPSADRAGLPPRPRSEGLPSEPPKYLGVRGLPERVRAAARREAMRQAVTASATERKAGIWSKFM